jgi:hypothetical protein
MKLQEIFDRVVQHAHHQNAQAIDPETLSCKYRTDNGLSCLFGCLIPDNLYTPVMEGLSVWGATRKAQDNYEGDPQVEALLRVVHALQLDEDIPWVSLIRELQILHDNFEPDKWGSKLYKIADRYQLDQIILRRCYAKTGERL